MVSVAPYAVSPSDEEAIRAVLTAYRDIWNRHDMRQLPLLFTEDSHWINIVGMHWRGRSAVVAGHEAFHRSFFKATDIDLVEVGVRGIAAEVAVAVALLSVGPFTPPDNIPRPASEDRLSFILTNTGGAWRIAHGHNTVIDPVARRFDPVNSGFPRNGNEPEQP